MNKFDKLYNIVMEGLTKSLSDEQMTELKSETNNFLNSIKNNEKLKETNIIPSDIIAKEELSDNISDTVLFGSNKNIKENFLKIIEPLHLNFSENIIDNLLMFATNNKSDYKKLISFLNDRNNKGVELVDKLTLDDIANKTGLPLTFIKNTINIKRRKEWRCYWAW
jgi:hypothetical protein